MKDNKKKVIMCGCILIAVLVVLILVLVFGKKIDDLTGPSGDNHVVASLESGSQAEVDKLIKEDLENNKYKLKDARIYLNPYGGSPLSGLIAFHTEKATTSKVTVKGKHEDDIVVEYDAAKDHYLPVYALYANYENKVEVELGDGSKETFTIPMGILESTPRVIANETKEGVSKDGLYFVTSPINMRSFAVDAYGEIRWYAETSMYHNIVELENGHLLVGTSNFNNDGLSTQLVEVDYIGRVYKTYDIEEGYLNDFFVKDDGNIILASKNKDRKTYSDYIIEIDGKTGKVVKVWDVFKKLEEIDQLFVNEIDRNDYFYNSGIEYYEDSDSLLLTYWGGEFVINLSYKDGSIKWIFSNPDNFSQLFDSVLLKGGEGFVYPKAMHSASLDGDTLKVFDNGYSTNANNTNSANLIGSYSSANTYKINGKNITLASTIDEDKKFFSYALGDYEIVNDKDEIVLYGREFIDLDYASGVNINDYDKFGSRMIEKIDGETVVDLDFGWATYSVNKINLNGKAVFSFDNMEGFTTREPSAKESISTDIQNMINSSNASVPYEFGYSKGMIEHNVVFMDSDEVKLVLVKDNKEGYVYNLKEKDKEANKIVTDIPSGKYYVYVLENGEMYKTDSYLEIK